MSGDGRKSPDISGGYNETTQGSVKTFIPSHSQLTNIYSKGGQMTVFWRFKLLFLKGLQTIFQNPHFSLAI